MHPGQMAGAGGTLFANSIPATECTAPTGGARRYGASTRSYSGNFLYIIYREVGLIDRNGSINESNFDFGRARDPFQQRC
jgi:hypothetical protein